MSRDARIKSTALNVHEPREIFKALQDLVLDFGDLFLRSRRVLLAVDIIAGRGPLESNAGVHIPLRFQFGRRLPAVPDSILLLADQTHARNQWFRHLLDLARLGWASESVKPCDSPPHQTATSNASQPCH
jgi:hypothetical protein